MELLSKVSNGEQDAVYVENKLMHSEVDWDHFFDDRLHICGPRGPDGFSPVDREVFNALYHGTGKEQLIAHNWINVVWPDILNIRTKDILRLVVVIIPPALV